MSGNLKEWLSVAITLIGLAGIPIWVARQNSAQDPPDRRVIKLTGVMKDGAWTSETVNSLNYGLRKFEPAIIRLEENEKVIFRLTSADVTHGFCVPELNIGPLTIQPGEVEDVYFDADTTGVFTYYCTTICGSCHYFMRAFIYIGDVEAGTDLAIQGQIIGCPHESAHPENSTLLLAELVAGLKGPAEADAAGALIDRGRALYLQKGCVMCHRRSRQSGTETPGEGRDAAELPADAASIVNDPRYCPYQQFLARYEPARLGDRRGRFPGADTAVVRPPVTIPAWDTGLTDEDAVALSAYLLTNFEWSTTPE
jgi:hypothetical protein